MMSMTTNPSDTHSMLCLALLSYRGFLDLNLPRSRDERLDEAVRRGVKELALVRNEWDLVWGPVPYQSPFSIFDDSLMYVVRHVRDKHRYVVAIRGTNPVAGFDWMFGDLWVAQTMKWPYGDTRFPDARISLSTALGLNLLQFMESTQPPTDAAGELWLGVEQRIGGFARAMRDLFFRPAREAARTGLRAIQSVLTPIVSEVRDAQLRINKAPVLGQTGALLDEWNSERRSLLAKLALDAIHLLDDHFSLNLLRLLMGDARLQGDMIDGLNLVSFLKNAVDVADDGVELAVTGHSKGGALASTVALWLADTQGEDSVPEDARWDPQRKATMHCYSYAGPTAGNAEFAARSNAVIGPRCHRIANSLDVVPHAWTAADLARIPTLYDPGVAGIPGLGELTKEIASRVREHGYTHVGLNETVLEGRIAKHKPLFVDQLIHQHLNGYLEVLGVTDQLSQDSFFDPFE